MATQVQNDQALFENIIELIQSETANFGLQFTNDANVRIQYAKQVKAMAEELRRQAQSGKISWKQAAVIAQDTRNLIMETMRGRSSPIGQAIARQLKKEGKTLNELIAKKAIELYGKNVNVNRLSASQRNRIYAAIVESAGKANIRVSTVTRRLSYAGKGLVFISIAISTYNVITAEDKLTAIKHETTLIGAGIIGGAAGGALAGLACGPGAPVCVTIGVFVGGALTAFGADALWD